MALYFGRKEFVIITANKVYLMHIPIATHNRASILGTAKLGQMVLSYSGENSDYETPILGIGKLGQMVLI